MDSVLHGSFLRRGPAIGQDDASSPLPEALARFMVTKASWRGRYRRVLAITPTAVVTQHPDDLAVTNSYSFVGAVSDLDDAAPGGGSGDDQELVLTVRSDARVGAQPVTPPRVRWQAHLQHRRKHPGRILCILTQ